MLILFQESVIASTNPNRVTWISGSINAPGSPQTPSEGGIVIDNNVSRSLMLPFHDLTYAGNPWV